MNTPTIKTGTRIPIALNQRLVTISKEHGFKSSYLLIKYIIFAFVRAYDHEHLNIDTPMPPEIIKVFPIQEDANLVAHAIANIKKRQSWKLAKRKQRAGASCRDDDKIAEEVRELFNQCQEDASELEWKPDIRQRK